MTPLSENILDEKGLDNFFRFQNKSTQPNFRIEDRDPKDGENEPEIPKGYHIISLGPSFFDLFDPNPLTSYKETPLLPCGNALIAKKK